MKKKVSDYIAEYLTEHGITQGFTVTGGGAMHLNASFGHQSGLTMIYNHHEQACAMAAESYARKTGRPALLCVTTGPGGINALNGVCGAWLDSIPMIVISGQVRFDTTVRSTGLKLRAMGDQEFDICRAVSSMTKYCEMVTDPLKIRAALDKALRLAVTGRKGPCWLDIPMNVQSAIIETEDLLPEEEEEDADLPPEVDLETAEKIIEMIRQAERPVFYAGCGIRLSGKIEVFRSVKEKLKIPVVTAWDAIDLVESDDPLYVGRPGNMGDRAGNFAVQNSDLIFSVGCRQSIRQVSYAYDSWAKNATVIMNDIDREELQKPTLHVDFPVWADAGDLLEKMDALLGGKTDTSGKLTEKKEWLGRCEDWKRRYPVVTEKHYAQAEKVNVYAFVDTLSRLAPEGQTVVAGNGSACVVGSQAWRVKRGQRFLVNSAMASMGYDLPAAIGAWSAQRESGEEKDLILITGDGSIQMNLQELQTIIHHHMPVKIFMIENGGYHSIRQTQSNFFADSYVGVGEESGDLSFPDMSRLAPAYGYPYVRISDNGEMPEKIRQVLAMTGPVFCEVTVDHEQKFEPKSASKALPDGSMVSAPLEDMAPFLPPEELAENMKF